MLYFTFEGLKEKRTAEREGERKKGNKEGKITTEKGCPEAY